MGSSYTESQKNAILNYQAKQKSISIRVKPELEERYKAAAEKAGMSFRSFILEAIEEKIERM